jgi:hypothetical protein
VSVLTLIPAAVRQALYVLYAVAGVALGSIQVAFIAATVSQPAWLVVAFAIYVYIGGALGLTAAANVPTLTGTPAVAPTVQVPVSVLSAPAIPAAAPVLPPTQSAATAAAAEPAGVTYALPAGE